jgi:hypothetical protein
MNSRERQSLRAKLLAEQKGICPVCGYDSN